MDSNLKVVLLENDVYDAELIARHLETTGLGFCLTRIQSEAELRRELAGEKPDLILSDHGFPAFSGFKALEIVRETDPDLPFIFVCGSNDQGMVAKMYEEGATDYVFKKDIIDLKPAVLRALDPQPELPSRPVDEEKGPVPPVAMAFAPAIGRLSFCPLCKRARDESGTTVQMPDFCGSHAEIIVLRQYCSECGELHSPGV